MRTQAHGIVDTDLIEVATFTFVSEFLLALWLVIWGRRLTLSESGHHGDPTAVARSLQDTTSSKFRKEE